MKYLIKTLRIFLLVILMLLACIGIGMSGGIPVSASGKKDDLIEVKSIQEEVTEESEESTQEVKP